NAGSFTGHYRAGPEELAWQMVAEGLVDLVGSDHHGVRRSGVSPLAAYQALIARGEPELAERAMSATPSALLGEPGAEDGAGEISPTIVGDSFGTTRPYQRRIAVGDQPSRFEATVNESWYSFSIAARCCRYTRMKLLAPAMPIRVSATPPLGESREVPKSW